MLKVDIKKLDTGEVEISGEIAVNDFMGYWDKTVKTFADKVKIPGFRPGKAPEKMVVDTVGEDKILVEMAEQALSVIYPQIVKENKLAIASRPEISLTKVAKNNPLGFNIKVAVLPEVKLPDYKKIAGDLKKDGKAPEKVTTKEVDDVLTNLRQNKSLSMPENKDIDPKDKDKIVLPELNDDFAKSFGDFKTLADLKTKIKENLEQEKEMKAKEKLRLSILDALAEKTTIKIPETLIESELEKMLAELRHETSRMGLKFEDYLNHLKKTEEEMRKAWQADAEKRVKIGLILKEIITAEKFEAEKEELDKEVQHLISHLGEEKPAPEHLARIYSYAENTILHNKAFALLEK